jgi:O-antigen/teichoic acid export membrane protein
MAIATMGIKKNIAALWEYGNSFFSKGHQRTIEAKKNIAGNFFVKGLSIVISLLIVPLTINYVNSSRYGIWLALSSMIAWFSFFDIGFTHGLRNKFTAAKAKGDDVLARIYISTTYYYVAIIFSALWVLLLIINQFINWHWLLTIPAAMEAEVSKLAIIVFTYFCFQFIFRIIVTVLIADQKPALGAMLDMLGQLLALLIIFVLTKLTKGSLLNLGLASCIAPAVVMLLANVLFFNTKYRQYKPSVKLVKKEYARDIMSLGVKFFILQVACVLQFESILFLIAHYINTEQVTAFNIAYKYFFVLQMGFTILITPLWSGVTDAYNSGDIAWIQNVVKKYLLILVPFVVLGIVMLAAANRVYDLWLGKNVVYISYNISLLCLIFFIQSMVASIFVAVINGVGALKIQIIVAIFTAILFFSFCFLFIRRFNLGVEAILIASIVSNIFGYIIGPIQYYKIFIKKSQASIWYK